VSSRIEILRDEIVPWFITGKQTACCTPADEMMGKLMEGHAPSAPTVLLYMFELYCRMSHCGYNETFQAVCQKAWAWSVGYISTMI